MKDAGNRFQITIAPNRFGISDTLTGKKVLFSESQFYTFELDTKIVLDKLQTIQEAIVTYRRVKRVMPPRFLLTHSDTVQIDEVGHYNWRLVSGRRKAVIKDNTLSVQFGFDIDYVLKALNFVAAVIYNYKQPRKPRYDVVRRIADARLLVWVHGKDSLVVYEDDIDGLTMQDVIVNGDYYQVLLVGVSKELGQATLFNANFEEVIAFPLDDSILEYYPLEEATI